MQDVLRPYMFVRDVWDSQTTLPVYANALVEKWWSLDISGRLMTIAGKRVLAADRLRLYVDSDGQPFIMFPTGLLEPEEWPYMQEVPMGVVAASDIPPPPDPQQGDPPAPLTAPEGTIAGAKLNGGDVSLEGKVVTAVFYQSGTRTVAFFYIQEPAGSGYDYSGIKVVPQSAVTVEPGRIVSVAGSVDGGPSVAECHIDATSVSKASFSALPAPLFMCQRSTAGGQFGDSSGQSALYQDTTATPAKLGSGLNAVGIRVRVCGSVTWSGDEGGYRVHYIDDGSNLRCAVQTQERVGIRLVHPPGMGEAVRTVGDYLAVTGILGAEMADGDLPVPVLRVPCHNVIHVRPGGSDSENGWSWASAKATIQAGLDAANATNPKCDVWVAAGTFQERITLRPGVPLYGGFAGTETARSQRPAFPRQSPDPNETVLDGERLGDVVTASDVNVYNTVDGFTIINGDSRGLYCTGVCAPTIANNKIESNARGIELSHSSTAYGYICDNYISHNGTGIICSRSAATVVDNHIDHNGYDINWPGTGVGIHCQNDSSPTIERNWIEYNNHSRTYAGGGIYCSGGEPEMRNNVIKGNEASNGGGIYITGSCSATITNNTIVDNEPNGNGGGIYIGNSDATIANNVIAFNSAGYGIYAYGSTCSVVLSRNCSYSNTPSNYYCSPPGLLDYSGDYQTNPYLSGDHVHLTSSSTSCIDDANSAYCVGAYDIDGDPRIVEGDQQPPALGDIGADEYVP